MAVFCQLLYWLRVIYSTFLNKACIQYSLDTCSPRNVNLSLRYVSNWKVCLSITRIHIYAALDSVTWSPLIQLSWGHWVWAYQFICGTMGGKAHWHFKLTQNDLVELKFKSKFPCSKYCALKKYIDIFVRGVGQSFIHSSCVVGLIVCPRKQEVSKVGPVYLQNVEASGPRSMSWLRNMGYYFSH